MPETKFLPASAADLAHIAAEITGSWHEVATVWEQFRVRYSYHLRADQLADKDAFLKEALWAAHGRGQLEILLQRLEEADLTSSTLVNTAKGVGSGGFQFQSYVNGEWVPQDALEGGRKILQACDHVCRISIDGQHKGTGILLRPTLVATAGHVVHTLVGNDHQALPGSVGRIEITFVHADDLRDEEGAVVTPIPATLHEDWLSHFSPPAPGEGTAGYDIQSVNGIVSEDGPWDVALLRLAAPPREGLAGHRLYTSAIPSVSFGMHVLHHPADAMGKSMPLLWSIGSMQHALGAPDPLRWLHNANTDSGSSGAPCFDNNWRVVALHQAGAGKLDAKGQSNRAVPIYRWGRNLDALADSQDSTPYLDFVLDENHPPLPVFGRRDLQRRAWRAMTSRSQLSARQRSFVVLGEKGTGKSFTSAILNRLAIKAVCPFASLDVKNFVSEDAITFATSVVGAFSDAPVDVSTFSTLTTELRDVQNQVAPRLCNALEKLANEQPLWLVLDGLEVCDAVPQSGPAQVVDALIAMLDKAGHLNLVLVGWKGPVTTEHAEELPPAPSADDVLDHVLLSVAPPGFRAAGSARQGLLAYIQKKLLDQPAELPPYQRAAKAAEIAQEFIKEYLANFAHFGNGAMP